MRVGLPWGDQAWRGGTLRKGDVGQAGGSGLDGMCGLKSPRLDRVSQRKSSHLPGLDPQSSLSWGLGGGAIQECPKVKARDGFRKLTAVTETGHLPSICSCLLNIGHLTCI